MAHEEAARRPDGIDNTKTQIAQVPQRRNVIGEKAVQRIRRSGQHEGIEPPPALIAFQGVQRADVPAQPRGIQQHFRQRGRILESQIQPLPGNRVDAASVNESNRRQRS